LTERLVNDLGNQLQCEPRIWVGERHNSRCGHPELGDCAGDAALPAPAESSDDDAQRRRNLTGNEVFGL
jgi:hypothetical protein